MKFVLLTKFAMRFEKGNPRRRYEERKDWVDYRMKLFKKYCLPSVAAQTVKDFDWWFLVDPTFPGFTKDHETELLKHGNILWDEVCWKESQVEVGELLSGEYKDMWVCSARLDSDDVIVNNYLELANNYITEEAGWYGFSHGYMMKDQYAVNREHVSTPFLLRVEYANPFKSVFTMKHISSYNRHVVNMIENPAWIQVYHGDNIKNRIKKKVPDFIGKRFDAECLRKNFTWGVGRYETNNRSNKFSS